LSGGHWVIGITNGHFIHAGPLLKRDQSFYLYVPSSSHPPPHLVLQDNLLQSIYTLMHIIGTNVRVQYLQWVLCRPCYGDPILAIMTFAFDNDKTTCVPIIKLSKCTCDTLALPILRCALKPRHGRNVNGCITKTCIIYSFIDARMTTCRTPSCIQPCF
jgi:hypothetical protein